MTSLSSINLPYLLPSDARVRPEAEVQRLGPDAHFRPDAVVQISKNQ